MREIPASASMQLSADSGGGGGSAGPIRQPRDSNENTILINTKDQQHHENAVVGTLRHVRLRHAKELLSVDPKKFVYSGTVSKQRPPGPRQRLFDEKFRTAFLFPSTIRL